MKNICSDSVETMASDTRAGQKERSRYGCGAESFIFQFEYNKQDVVAAEETKMKINSRLRAF